MIASRSPFSRSRKLSWSGELRSKAISRSLQLTVMGGIADGLLPALLPRKAQKMTNKHRLRVYCAVCNARRPPRGGGRAQSVPRLGPVALTIDEALLKCRP